MTPLIARSHPFICNSPICRIPAKHNNYLVPRFYFYTITYYLWQNIIHLI